MSTVKVFRNDEKVFQSNISNQFHINESPTGELNWSADLASIPEGLRQIWIQAIGFDPMISAVFPHWQLIINGVWMEAKIYNIVEHLKGKEVELRYKEYRFVFQFD